MKDDIIDLASFKRRKAVKAEKTAIRSGVWSWPKRSPFAHMPGPILRMLHFMFDAPDDPPMVKLGWLLSYFGEVPLPDGRTYRLHQDRLEVQGEGGWTPSSVTMDGLARLVTGLKREQWQAIATSCRRRTAEPHPEGFWSCGKPPGVGPA